MENSTDKGNIFCPMVLRNKESGKMVRDNNGLIAMNSKLEIKSIKKLKFEYFSFYSGGEGKLNEEIYEVLIQIKKYFKQLFINKYF